MSHALLPKACTPSGCAAVCQPIVFNSGYVSLMLYISGLEESLDESHNFNYSFFQLTT